MSLLLLLLTSSHFTLSLSLDTITPTQPLNDGQTLLSSSHTFQLGFFPSNNHRYVGIWYHNLPDHTIVWVANRDNPLIGVNGTFSITRSGNLVLLDDKSNVVWSTTSQATKTTAHNKPMARLLDNGNLVLLDGSWQSFDYPTDTMLPEMKLGWDRKTGLNRFITSWRSPDDPSTGDKLFKLDLHGLPQIMLYDKVENRTDILYRTGPWNGLRFSGSPEISSFGVFALQFTLTPNEAYYTYKVITNGTQLARLVVTPTGVVQWLVWMDKPKKWNQVWYAPKDPCSTYNKCGPNGVCNTSDINQCECLKGFEPKVAQDWKMRDWSDGCVRRTRVCGGGGEGFVY
ncbi:Receptor-like serine/threonine-protein kinase SD1-8 [Acorus gramineus]|uniref:Receptor-like serine/threonine-protein kinase SD1-8 n=1 Tax=Acorus gramineus TaxID=55184 RepID=A0AAV9AAJ3_ACOGR|nr:Receptor-like serine/threonine-protein kinase SD1-8 [Acorus gramineus]